jgi:predicted O-methyltransferase YrrM
VDNVLWSGSVIDKKDKTEDTVAIRQFNETLHADRRIELSLLPIGDGLTLARKHP